MLPKYVTPMFARNRFLVLADPLLVFECRRAYELFAWLWNNGYAMTATGTWERRYA